jgi:hypothetical protein
MEVRPKQGDARQEEGMPTAGDHILIQDVMGAFVPESLDNLIGPTERELRLPLHLYWGPAGAAQLTDRDHVAELYQAVIRVGSAADQEKYLNRSVLVELWPSLMLPTANRELWENAFPELRQS